jgi:hypothetical protein
VSSARGSPRPVHEDEGRSRDDVEDKSICEHFKTETQIRIDRIISLFECSAVSVDYISDCGLGLGFYPLKTE